MNLSGWVGGVAFSCAEVAVALLIREGEGKVNANEG